MGLRFNRQDAQLGALPTCRYVTDTTTTPRPGDLPNRAIDWDVLPPGATGQILTVNSDSSIGWSTGIGTVACPDAYGAIGNGTIDDTAAINAAIASGLSVWLTPGKTYLTYGGHVLSAGQILYGNGATLERANQIHSVCTSTVTSGTTAVAVTSAAGFTVGQWITVANAAQGSSTGGTNYDQSPRQISAINGLTLTVSTTWAVTITSGTCYTTGAMLTLSGAGSKVYDLVINGNASGQTWARWETSWGISLIGDKTIAQRCYVYNGAADGFEMQGNYPRADSCVAYNCKGNGFHLSGTEHPVVHACVADTCNQNTNVGHAMGGIGWSNTIQDATVSDCYVTGCLNGCGTIDSSDNSDLTVTNSTFRSCTNAGIDVYPSSSASSPQRMVLSNNRIYSCAYGIRVYQSNGAGSSSFPTRVTIIGNSFDGCTSNNLLIQYANYINVVGNRFEAPTGTGSIVQCGFDDVQNITVSGNLFNGGSYGIYVDSQSGLTANVTLSGNTLSSQYTGAIRFQGAGMSNVIAQGNAITNDTTAGNNYVAILTQFPSVAQGNSIVLTNNGGTITGVMGIQLNSVATATGVGGSHAIGNIIRGTAQYGIRAPGGTHGCSILSNITSAGTPLSDGGGYCTTPATFGTVTFSGGAITAVPVTGGGSGYSGTPGVYVYGGGGSGYTLTPVMSSGSIASITVTSGGTGFTSTPTAFSTGNFEAANQVTG